MSGCARSHMEQLIQNVLFKLQRPAFLLSPNPKTSSGLSRMLPCKRLLSIWMWLHSYGEGGDVGFVCSAPVIFLVFFMVPRYFFFNAGNISHPWCPWELQWFPAGAQPVCWLLSGLLLRGVLCVVGGSESWELKEVKFVFGSWNTWGEVIDHNLRADLAMQRTAHHHVHSNGLVNGNGADGCFLIIPLCCKC